MTFQCKDGCSDCCGNINLKKSLISKHLNKIQQIPEETLDLGDEVFPLTDDSKCIFLIRKTNKCSIYDDRPYVCRIYGTGIEPKLLCPHIKPNGNPRSEAVRKEYTDKLNEILKNL